ncbi:DUF6252 family protein [Flavobacterium sp. DG2-3]|uniref:DUF6252 family protein n=1 Tax=Flavobacterium sp. DG2-3 TaxID=3068317 RepID=UPI00273D3A34|nr:DUF6252 family protein [Flavobacterium sp. DG2-3]MDP5198671.1 DUF6252 family protein [Flavobacterium sp. DG2-3]
MKKYFCFLSLILLLGSCTADIASNNTAFQALKENTFWRAQIHGVEMETNGVFIVESSLGYEQINFQLPEIAEKTFVLGVDENTKAIYKTTIEGQEAEFSTGAGKGNGEITVTEYNKEENTISGTFKFTAVNTNPDAEKQEIHFTEGVFYKIKIGADNKIPAE